MARMILDIDSVGDDILAIFFAGAHPEIVLEGVTTVCGASGSIEQATKVALNMLDLAGRSDVPVHAGAWRPIIGNSKEDMEKPVHFEKQLKARFGERLKGFNPPAPQPGRAASGRHAVDAIIETVMGNPGEISLVATGPLTNLGMALLQEPRVATAAKECIVMGGTFGTPGNMTPVVEYNVWADPEAAKILFTSGINLTIVGLDVCEDNRAATSMLTRDDLADFEGDVATNPVARHIVGFLPIYIDIWREFFDLVGFPTDDAIAAAMTIDPTICTFEGPYFVDVETEGKLTRGQTIPHRGRQLLPGGGKPNARIATAIDGRRFVRLFKDTIRRYGAQGQGA